MARDLHLHQVRGVIEVVDQGSVAAAARVVKVPAATLAQWIRALERDLGVQIFHRIGRGLVLTAPGEALMPRLRRIARSAAVAQARVGVHPELQGGTLRIACHDTLAGSALPDLIAQLRTLHSNSRVRVSRLGEHDAVEDTLADGHDVAVCTFPVEVGPDLVTTPVDEHEYVLCAPPGTPLPVGPIGYADVPQLPLISLGAASSQVVEFSRTLRAAGYLRGPVAVVEPREAHLDFVLAGLGIAFVERGLAGRAAANGAQVRGLDPPIRMAYGFVHDPAQISPLTESFLTLAAPVTR